MPDRTFAPAFMYLRVDPKTGATELWGKRCRHCEAVVLGERRACPACYARDSLGAVELALAGTLQNYTIVYRSYPGIQTPFIAAIIDLDGGGTLKGTLRNCPADAATLPRGLRVRVRFGDSGQRDRNGRALVCHYFEREAIG